MPNTTDTTTRTPLICDNFAANPGDRIEWKGLPASGCMVFQNRENIWPFSLPSPITLPSSTPVTIKSSLAPGVYFYDVSCCIPLGDFKVVTIT